MDVEDLVIDDRKTMDSFVKMLGKKCVKFLEGIIYPARSSIIVFAKKV